jgi:hypothetical protein
VKENKELPHLLRVVDPSTNRSFHDRSKISWLARAPGDSFAKHRLGVGSGDAGEIAKVTHVLKLFARFSVSRSL